MSEFTVRQLIAMLPAAYQPAAKNPEKQLDAVNATIQIVAKGDNGGDWYIHIDDLNCTTYEGTTNNPDLKLTAKAQDLLDIISGKMDAIKAYMLGKVRFSGDLNLALKISQLFVIPEEILEQRK
ncbi:MAG: hypothetical protein BGO78_16195 [Chloroflexi bacterium 44-23]|nr:MAG: hypothetical protein BGO78_16195 [Chloroflexi bacterium 44-23]